MDKKSVGSRVFDTANIVIFVILGLVCFFPFLYVLSASFSSSTELIKHDLIIFPVGFTLDNYKYIFLTDKAIAGSLVVSVFVTIAGTLINLVVTSLMAYPLAHTHIFGYKVIMGLVVFTLVFGGGMIPTYILVQKLGMLDTYWSVLLPGAVTAYNLIIFISFFKSLPSELEEAAKIDGCNDVRTLFQIILPLCKPLFATFTLMFAVAHWNSWFDYVLYISNSKMWPIQVQLQQILNSADTAIGLEGTTDYVPPTDVVKYCVIIVSTVPILCIYPFLQKYFSKGIMIGSVKG